jgi:hypothetical protein
MEQRSCGLGSSIFRIFAEKSARQLRLILLVVSLIDTITLEELSAVSPSSVNLNRKAFTATCGDE